ncbi:MAG: peptidoglycan-binding domain-containing protein [Sarcina sp.]
MEVLTKCLDNTDALDYIEQQLELKFHVKENNSKNMCGNKLDSVKSSIVYSLQRLEGFPPKFCSEHSLDELKNRLPILTAGVSNEFVEILQYALYCGGYKNIKFTKVFDEATQKAVLHFNMQHNISKTSIVIPKFWGVLLQI